MAPIDLAALLHEFITTRERGCGVQADNLYLRYRRIRKYFCMLSKLRRVGRTYNAGSDGQPA